MNEASVLAGPASRGFELTLGRLLEERLLHGARIVRGEDLPSQPVRWCHALADVECDGGGDLAGVVVLADVGEVGPQQWRQLAKSGCAAVLVRGDGGWRPGTVPLPGVDGLVVVQVPASVQRRAIVELVATL